MPTRKPYRPATPLALEPRVVLSHDAPHPRPAAVSVVSRINAAFDGFGRDYTAQRTPYFASLNAAPSPASPADGAAFLNYTRYRVDLLAQQLNGALVAPATTAAKHGPRGPGAALFQIVRNRVNAADTSTPNPRVFQAGTLGRSLLDTTPVVSAPATTSTAAPVAPFSATTTNLDALAQDQAIAAARAGVLNGYGYNKLKADGHHS